MTSGDDQYAELRTMMSVLNNALRVPDEQFASREFRDFLWIFLEKMKGKSTASAMNIYDGLAHRKKIKREKTKRADLALSVSKSLDESFIKSLSVHKVVGRNGFPNQCG